MKSNTIQIPIYDSVIEKFEIPICNPIDKVEFTINDSDIYVCIYKIEQPNFQQKRKQFNPKQKVRFANC